jgi:ABC-type antimicrobial peptide transport system permease subunit
LVSSLVFERRREIGLRLALGSNIRQAMLNVARRGLAPTIAGLAAGLLLCAFVLRVLDRVVYGVKPYDPVTLASTVALLALVGAAASFLPTLRMIRIQPAETLREE